MSDPASVLHGAELVNDEVEVGFNERFERRWVWVQRVGTAIMVLFTVANLSGALGRGPFSHHTVKSIVGGLTVDYEPVSRAQTPTQVTLHVSNRGPGDRVEIFLGSISIEPMGLTRITPQPLDTKAVDGGLILSLSVPAGTLDGLVRLQLMPVGPGLFEQEAHLVDHQPVRWTQAVLP